MGLFIWVRWMWPRFRYDQLMDLGWRRFLPLALANIVATALWLWAGGLRRIEPHDCQTNQIEFLGAPVSPGGGGRASASRCATFSKRK